MNQQEIAQRKASIGEELVRLHAERGAGRGNRPKNEQSLSR